MIQLIANNEHVEARLRFYEVILELARTVPSELIEEWFEDCMTDIDSLFVQPKTPPRTRRANPILTEEQ
jgi:hypothetical protein